MAALRGFLFKGCYMNARNAILSRLKDRNRPPKPFGPSINPIAPEDLKAAFVESLEAAGGRVISVETVRLWDRESVQGYFDDVKNVIDARKGVDASVEEMAACDLAIVEGEFGVAENGAVYIDPQGRYPRALLTLAKNLAVILPSKDIVPTMPEAYERIDLNATDYALFMAGPSKTADIEQSLVIGAHGAMGVTVFFSRQC